MLKLPLFDLDLLLDLERDREALDALVAVRALHPFISHAYVKWLGTFDHSISYAGIVHLLFRDAGV